MRAEGDPEIAARRRALRLACRRRLSGRRPRPVDERLRALAALPEARLPPDHYGRGGAVQALEEEVAALLGKPRGVFCATGVLAQGAALQAWAEIAAVRAVAIPARSHLAVDEEDGMAALHALDPVRLGPPEAPYGAPALAAVEVALAAAVVELPLRRAAFRLPPFPELEALRAEAARKGLPLHLDGARLWEAAAGYGAAPAAVAAPFASVYVSLYKGLGGFGGALLLGEPEWLARVEPWLTRLGGRPFDASPSALSALEGLRTRLPRLPGDCARARRLAAALVAAGFPVSPDPPHVQAFVVTLPVAPAALRAAAEAHARDVGDWLVDGLQTADPAASGVEVQVGEATEDFDDAEVADGLQALVDRAARS